MLWGEGWRGVAMASAVAASTTRQRSEPAATDARWIDGNAYLSTDTLWMIPFDPDPSTGQFEALRRCFEWHARSGRLSNVSELRYNPDTDQTEEHRLPSGPLPSDIHVREFKDECTVDGCGKLLGQAIGGLPSALLFRNTEPNRLRGPGTHVPDTTGDHTEFGQWFCAVRDLEPALRDVWWKGTWMLRLWAVTEKRHRAMKAIAHGMQLGDNPTSVVGRTGYLGAGWAAGWTEAERREHGQSGVQRLLVLRHTSTTSQAYRERVEICNGRRAAEARKKLLREQPRFVEELKRTSEVQAEHGWGVGTARFATREEAEAHSHRIRSSSQVQRRRRAEWQVRKRRAAMAATLR